MKVSVDGLRSNLAEAYKKAVSGYQEITRGEPFYEKPGFYELKEGLDELRTFIGALMCVYSEDPEDMFSNMTDEAFKLPCASPDDEQDEES